MFRDREYFSLLARIALPIAIQNLISSSLNAVGVLLVGQLGDVAVAAVGLANQIFFLLNLMLFGMASGSAIFTAQFWGRGDRPGIRKVVVLCLSMTLVAGVVFTIIAIGFPSQVLSLYTDDEAVIILGSQYLQIIGISYLATAITYTYAFQMRSIGMVQPPMLVSVVTLSLGTILNYAFIFGAFSLPAMGTNGAALGTCLARLLESAAIVAITYFGKFPTAIHWHDVYGLNWGFIRRFMTTVLPVAANETIWSLGITIYNMIYARIDTASIAAVNITSTIESMAFVAFIGIANGSAVMIGNRIGANEKEKAYEYARRSLIIVIVLAVVVGILVFLLTDTILAFYKVSATTAYYARGILTVLACALWVRSSNLTVIVGILRSGGDTRFSLLLDTGTVWLVGIPMALLGAFVLHLPVYWVVLMVMSDEVTKFIVGMRRFLSRKWINDLAGSEA